MVIPEIKRIYSADIERPNLPPDAGNCQIHIQVFIGPKGEQSSDTFSFALVTPSQLSQMQLPTWGRGMLIAPAFSWEAVDHHLQRLLAHATRASWPEVAAVLNKDLDWEFDNYQPYKS